jgi:dihydrofolate reductase / thymidylate synthase
MCTRDSSNSQCQYRMTTILEAKFDLVVACDSNRGIGKENGLPWRLPGDMKHFRELTSKVENASKRNAVLMGRKTWESIPKKFRPLPDRVNAVLTRNTSYQINQSEGIVDSKSPSDSIIVCDSIDSALDKLSKLEIEKYFIIGGAHLYEQAVHHPSCNFLYLTEIDEKFECDVFFPSYENLFTLVSTSKTFDENGIRYCFKKYQRTT